MGSLFSEPVDVHIGGTVRAIASLAEAEQLMVDVAWPVRGARYDEAVTLIALAIDGERSTADAERAFREAAAEAGILFTAS